MVLATDASAAEGGDGQDALEPGPPSDTWAPRDVLARRLSLFLWNDPALDPTVAMALATATTPNDVATFARTMLNDPRAREGVAEFFRWWLRLGDLTSQPKDDPEGIFTSEVRASLQKEAPAFGASVILDGDARYETLMTAPYTFMDETLARHYGVAGVSGPDLRRVDFGDPRRIGLLGEAGVLARFAGQTNPTWPPRRFWLVRQTVLCRRGLSSANPVTNSSFVIAPDRPLREQLDTLTAPTSPIPCHQCHVVVNPFGYAFLGFNAFGQLQEDGPAGPFTETSATLPAGAFFDRDLTFLDQPDLMRKLVAEPEAKECFAWIVLNFAVGRPSRSDVAGFSNLLEPSLAPLAAQFEASDGDIRELMVSTATTPGFLQLSGPLPSVDAATTDP